MNKRVPVLIFLFFFLLIFLCTPLSLYVVSSSNNTYQTHPMMFLKGSSLASTPLVIVGNSQLANRSSTGDGSKGNPYIIENYSINCTSNTNGVSVQNTNKYFILRNITVSNCDTGFYFSSVTFGNIANSLAINNSGYGYYLSSSSNNTLTNNIALDTGFYLSFSPNNTLVTNTATRSVYGYSLSFSSNNTLLNNTATKDSEGFFLESSSNNILGNNIATNGGNGFDLLSSNNNTLFNNTGLNNQIYDYFTRNSANNVLINNTFGKSLTTTTLPSVFTLPPTTVTNPALIGPLSIFGNVDIISLVVLGIVILFGLTIFLYSRRKQFDRSQNDSKNDEHSILHKLNPNKPSDTTFDHSGKILPRKDATTSIILVEDMLKETYQAPDYATAVKIQQGGFPDYSTYKQAIDKGIRTYAEWIQHHQDKQ